MENFGSPKTDKKSDNDTQDHTQWCMIMVSWEDKHFLSLILDELLS